MNMHLTDKQRNALRVLGNGKKNGDEVEPHISAIHELVDKHLASIRKGSYLSNSQYWLTPVGKMVHDLEFK